MADIIGRKDVQKRIEDLDRRGKTNGVEKYLTYPENARYFLDEDGEEEDGDRLKLEEALKTFGLEDGKKETAKENALAISSTLAERAMDMPLVAVRRGKQNNNAMYMVKSTKRPPKRIEYDFSIGRVRFYHRASTGPKNRGRGVGQRQRRQICLSRFGIYRLEFSRALAICVSVSNCTISTI